MAVIGGVQGAQVLQLPALLQAVEDAITLQANTTGNSSAQVNQTQNTLGPLLSPPIATFPGESSVSVNLLDNIAENDTSVTPLQFSGGIAADCRAYYMPADITSMANTWARVARGVKAGGKGLCINGTLTVTNTSTNATVGSNGSAPLTFQGSANLQFPLSFGTVLFSVVSGFVISLLL